MLCYTKTMTAKEEGRISEGLMQIVSNVKKYYPDAAHVIVAEAIDTANHYGLKPIEALMLSVTVFTTGFMSGAIDYMH